MATDIARLSFDAGRRYTGVLAQQGRVSLEAEENEAQRIGADERRAELVDIIGPAGTPDGGYAVGQGTGFDLTVGAGTLYVGGNRVTLAAPLDYGLQPDWLDYSDDPSWQPVPDAAPGNEDVVLVLIERDVTAVEDPALREVALGGPDGAARLRLLQHVERLATDATTCADAATTTTAAWAAAGLGFDPATMQLTSLSALQVTWTGTGQPTDPCEPSAAGGYLGAENQAIRVQVAAVNLNGTFDLLWGWDDGSMLYPVSSDGAAQPTLTFARSPVDDYHQPRAGQAVQVLRDAAQLASTDGTVEGWVASLSGQNFVLASAYQPDTKTLQLPAAITGDAAVAAATPQLYLRSWQALLPGQSFGTPVQLTGTGMAVTITAAAGAPPHLGDYWVIAVRPGTPQAVYPARLLREPQPPDGPQLWACPLAVVTWQDGSAGVTSCVPAFPVTGDDGCCCTVDIGPPDVNGGATLQALLDRYAGKGPVTICLEPGTYTLRTPLVIGPELDGLTLQACGAGVVLRATEDPVAAFALGLIVVERATSVTLRGLRLSVPQSRFIPAQGWFSGLPQNGRFLEFLKVFLVELVVTIGISVRDAAGLAVEGCVFDLPDPGQRNCLGAGIFATGTVGGLRLAGCAFQRADPPAAVPFNDLVTDGQAKQPFQLTFGYLQLPGAPREAVAARLDDATIEGCEFTGVTVALLAMTELGAVQAERNTVSDSYGGFWFISLADVAQTYAFANATMPEHELYAELATMGLAALVDPVLAIAAVMGLALAAVPVPGLAGAGVAALSAAQLTVARETLAAIYALAAGTARLPAEVGELVTTLSAAGTADGTVIKLPGNTGVPMGVDVRGCQVDATVANSYSGAGLLILDVADTVAAAGSALIHDNRITSRFPRGEAILVYGLARPSPVELKQGGSAGGVAATVTGNVVTNEIPGNDSYSVVLLLPLVQGNAIPPVAITGNVFFDDTLVPSRPNIPPAIADLADWDWLNTVVRYVAPPPVVTGVSPASGPADGGTAVTVTGRFFTGASDAQFSGQSGLNPQFLSDFTLEVNSPPGVAGEVADITVITDAGTSTVVAADEFSYAQATQSQEPAGRAAAADPAADRVPGEPAPTVPAPTLAVPSSAGTTVIMPALARPALQLRVSNSVDAGRTFGLEPGDQIIGRGDGPKIRLRDTRITQYHALLQVRDDGVTIADLNSTNGTRVNGVAVEQQTFLVPGDQIELGGVQLTVEAPPAP